MCDGVNLGLRARLRGHSSDEGGGRRPKSEYNIGADVRDKNFRKFAVEIRGKVCLQVACYAISWNR